MGGKLIQSSLAVTWLRIAGIAAAMGLACYCGAISMKLRYDETLAREAEPQA